MGRPANSKSRKPVSCGEICCSHVLESATSKAPHALRLLGTYLSNKGEALDGQVVEPLSSEDISISLTPQ